MRSELDRLCGEKGLSQRILIVTALANRLESEAVYGETGDPDKVWELAQVVRGLTSARD